LLAKVLPDLQSTAITGDDGGPININVLRFADRNPSE